MVYFLLLINLYARFTRYEPWFISDINHISWIVFILAKFNFTKWLSISPRFQAFHQDDFNFTKSFSISPRVFRFHQESCALGEKNFTKILTKMGGPIINACLDGVSNWCWKSGALRVSTYQKMSSKHSLWNILEILLEREVEKYVV